MNLILFAAKFDVPLAPAAPSSLDLAANFERYKREGKPTAHSSATFCSSPRSMPATCAYRKSRTA
jgi:hypothetical protein